MGKSIVVYIRVSTQKQGRSGPGLEGQQAAIERFCATEGYEITGPLSKSRPPRALMRSNAGHC